MHKNNESTEIYGIQYRENPFIQGLYFFYFRLLSFHKEHGLINDKCLF